MSSRTDELPGTLNDLCSELADILDSEDVEVVDEPYVKRHYRAYPEELGSSRILGTHDESVSKETWSTETYERVFEELRDKDIFSDCIENISRRGEMETDEAEDYLERFTHRIMDMHIDCISENEIINQITLFLSDIDNSPVLWQGTVWLDGLTTDMTIRLDEDVTLRERTDEDLVDEMPAIVAEQNREQPSVAPASIVEFDIRTNSVTDVDSKRDEILSTLQLYTVVTISEIRWRRNSAGFGGGPRVFRRFSIEREQLHSPPFEYEIEEDEQGQLREFFGGIRPIVADKIINADEDNYLTIAFDRYQTAVADDDSAESRLTSSIMCLEALLLGDEGELSDKLSRRTGILLGHYDDYQPIEVSNKIKSAYNIRSRYVHGSKIDESDDITSLTNKIVDYSRKCLVTVLQLYDETPKQKLLNKLDRAALHEAPRDDLNDIISDNCNV